MKGRPAETASVTAAIGGLLAVIFGITDPATLSAILAGVGLLPGVVSMTVDAGGVRGVLRKLWRGRAAPHARKPPPAPALAPSPAPPVVAAAPPPAA